MMVKRKKRLPGGRSWNRAENKARAAQARMRSIIDRLVIQHQLTELEGSWLLKAWELEGATRTRNSFACYLAGFMAGIAFKTVEMELRIYSEMH